MYDTQEHYADSNALLLNGYIDFYGLFLNLIQGKDFNRSCELDSCERLRTPHRKTCHSNILELICRTKLILHEIFCCTKYRAQQFNRNDWFQAVVLFWRCDFYTSKSDKSHI